MRLTPGARLGSYEIIAPLGAGGMGEVYRALDTRLGRDIALKVLPDDVAASPDRLARFEREARAVAALNHPNIVTIHSIEDHEGVRFLTMEVIEGQSLDTHSLPGGLPVTRVLEIGIGLADALAAAHEKGVVHRDLKPANVMVMRDGRLKVLDFGLARLEAVDDDAVTRATTMAAPLTTAGTVMGTVHYMAPEQLVGGSVDARADLFALGILLYEMTAGRRPFEGATLPEVCGAILHKAPPPLASIRTDLPSDFEGVVARCLEKNPRERFHAAHVVGSELRRIAKAVERGESGPTLMPGHTPAAQVSIAVLPFSDMSATRDQDYLCEGMAEEIMSALMRIDGIRVASRTSAFRAGRSGDDLPAISRALSVGHVLEGSVRTAGARMRVTAQLTEVASGYQLWSQRFDREAVDVFAIQDEIASGVVDAVKTRLSPGARSVHARQPAHDLEAYRSYLRGRHLRGIEDFGGAMRAFQDAVRLDPAHAPSWTGLAEITVLSAHMGMIPPRAACTSARRALATANELQGESAEGLHVEAFAAFLERRWDAMDKAWRRAIELQPDYVLGLASFGLTLCGRQQVHEGLSLLERARQCDPLASFPYTLTGWALLESGRPDEAVRYLEDALTFEKDDASAISAACMAYVATGRFEEGIAAGERGVAVTHRAPYFIGVLGWALATAGRIERARTILEELRTRPADAPVAVVEAWLLGALGEIDEAFAVLARAEEEHQGLLCYTGQPGFDALRSDPRFAALMTRLGLSPTAHPLTHDREQPQTRVASIAVLPFVNRSRDADDEYFSDGLADELIHMLAKVRGLRVAARASSFHFKGKDVPPADVGKALHVAALLDGSVRRAGDRVRISVQLMNASDGRHLWSENYDRTLDDIFAVHDDIAQSVVRELGTTMLGDPHRVPTSSQDRAAFGIVMKERTCDPESYDLYLRGRNLFGAAVDGPARAQELFRQAIERSPRFALAYAGLGESYVMQSWLGSRDREINVSQAKGALAKALALDDQLCEARVLAAQIKLYFDWDWAGAEHEFLRAIEFNPSSDLAHREHGCFLSFMGRSDEGLDAARKAQTLDPLSVNSTHEVGYQLLTLGRLNEAAVEFRKAIDLNPSWIWGNIKLGMTYSGMGAHDRAMACVRRADELLGGAPGSPLAQTWLAAVELSAGDSTRARAAMTRLQERSRTDFVDPLVIAWICYMLGEHDAMFTSIEAGHEQRSPLMPFIGQLRRFLWREVSDDPRYERLMQRMGFVRLQGRTRWEG